MEQDIRELEKKIFNYIYNQREGMSRVINVARVFGLDYDLAEKCMKNLVEEGSLEIKRIGDTCRFIYYQVKDEKILGVASQLQFAF